MQNVTAVLWAFLGICCAFFVPFFCVRAQFHITVLFSLDHFIVWQKLLLPASKFLSLWEGFTSCCLTLTLETLFYWFFCFLVLLFHMKYKDKYRNSINFSQFHQISAAHSYLAYLQLSGRLFYVTFNTGFHSSQDKYCCLLKLPAEAQSSFKHINLFTNFLNELGVLSKLLFL